MQIRFGVLIWKVWLPSLFMAPGFAFIDSVVLELWALGHYASTLVFVSVMTWTCHKIADYITEDFKS